MPGDGVSTRERILDAAEALVLDQGFSGTSLDRVLARTGFTKGAFFYHFRSKADLARALLERYAERDRDRLEGALHRAEQRSADPLEQVLGFVEGFEAAAEGLTRPEPGCLFAAYCYES
ncbi:MAG TPA: TetR/AcrR family transcriptional regulator, partial [Gammaproteobacteria bacterium]|nr:TetR/AcrR family transcriptional regulator [Gammaproteobacteria bacterium]